MKDWLTSDEIAQLRLPGLPSSKRTVNRWAGANGWRDAVDALGEPLCRPRKGHGGGYEFHKSLLPASALTRLEAQAGKARPEPAQVNSGTSSLKVDDVMRRDARLFILARADEFADEHHTLSREASDDAYATLYNVRRAEVPGWVLDCVGTLSGRSLKRWRGRRARGEMTGLAAGRGPRGGGVLETAAEGRVATYIGALIVNNPKYTAEHIRDAVDAEFALDDLPDARTFRRFIARWKAKNEVALTKLTNPDRFKSKFRLSGTNSNSSLTRLNELWEIDASPADVLTSDGRYSLYVVIDVWSRRMMASVSKTASTEGSLLLIRRAILEWGVPDTIRTDNGSDFKSYRFVRALSGLGIAQDVTAPFSPEQKGTIERAIGTLQRGLMTVLPGFIGHSVADRKVIEQRKAFSARLGQSDDNAFCIDMTAADLQRYVDEWCTGKYAHHVHRGIGMTPFAKAASYVGAVRKIENERALDMMLAPVATGDGMKAVTKQGIRHDGGYFISPDLFAGTKVFVRFDPEDMGRLHCFESEQGRFIATAICPERVGVDPREAIAQARAAQSQMLKDETQALRREANRIKPRDMVENILRGSSERNSSLTQFPRRQDTHSTPALDEAAIAADGGVAVPEIEAADIPVATPKVVSMPEPPIAKFRRARALERAIEAGDEVTTADAMWLGSYQATSEYRSQLAMIEDFGEEAYLRNS